MQPRLFSELHTLKDESCALFWRRLPDELRFADETLPMVIGLLAPGWIKTCVQAVICALCRAESDLGVRPLRSIVKGKLICLSSVRRWREKMIG